MHGNGLKNLSFLRQNLKKNKLVMRKSNIEITNISNKVLYIKVNFNNSIITPYLFETIIS
jgi:hypothetical protein